METIEKTNITVQTTVKAPVEKVWQLWTDPEHIIRWNSATPDWHTPEAENDVRQGGRFRFRMESRDGSTGFDFTGIYQTVVEHQEISYVMDDGRKAQIIFTPQGAETAITETFEAESTHSEDMQRQGWQAILNNFKTYAEAPAPLKKLHFQISVDAPAEKVYHTMLDDKSYREWTATFCPGSFFEGSWEKGAKILFVGLDKEGKRGGMVSRIKENIPNTFVSIEHLGVLEGDKEITSGPAVDGWAGALENYSFREEEGKTVVSVEMDANQDFEAYFSETWPKALHRLKELCEA
jgi:uncharacterized protein YndB with AHSA1/START domain